MATTQDIVRAATIHWEGDVAHGRGSIATESGKVQADYSFGTRFSSDPGTNPEELLAASHAACFTMALSAALTRAGHAPTSIDSKAEVSLRRTGSGKETCPLSRALRAVPTSLKAELK